MKRLNFNYTAPILESFGEDSEFMINGIAINSTTTSNNHKFLSEELQKSATTLSNVPLLKDHRNEVDAIVGRVLKGTFNEIDERVEFQARVTNKEIQKLIKNGDLNSVSVGASVEDVEETDDGLLIPKGITFKELSLVAIGADSGATFDNSFKEAYSHLSSKDIKITKEENMTEEETKTPESEKEEPKVEEPVEESAFERGLRMGMKLRESDEDEKPEEPVEVKKEEPKEEPVEEPEEEPEEDEDDEVEESYKIVNRPRSVSIVMAKY